MNDNFEISKEELENAEIIENIEIKLSDKDLIIKKVCDSLNQDFLEIINYLTPVHANLSREALIKIFTLFKKMKPKNTSMVNFILQQTGLKKETKELEKNYIFTIEYEQNKIILSIDKSVPTNQYPKIIATALADILCHYTNGENTILFSAYQDNKYGSNSDIKIHKNMNRLSHEIETIFSLLDDSEIKNKSIIKVNKKTLREQEEQEVTEYNLVA